MGSDLKPCPFCGSDVLRIAAAGNCWVSCKCGAAGAAALKNFAKAQENWNTRATDAELTRLRARCERLEAVAVAARQFRDETNGLLRAALGAQRPALKATTYQEICAALAALDQQPQQGQEVSK